MPFVLPSKKGWALALALVCGACSTAAPPLPADTTALNRTATVTLKDFREEDAALSCAEIGQERVALRQRMQDANAAIEGNRKHNQTVGYLGSLFLLPAIAAKTNEEEKDFLVSAQQRMDILNKLNGAKGCAPF